MKAVLGKEAMMLTRTMLRFRLENGAAELREAFDVVERHDFPTELVVTEVEPVLRYVRSTAAFVRKDPRLEPVLDDAGERIAAHIDRDGAFRIRTGAGCFVCR